MLKQWNLMLFERHAKDVVSNLCLPLGSVCAGHLARGLWRPTYATWCAIIICVNYHCHHPFAPKWIRINSHLSLNMNMSSKWRAFFPFSLTAGVQCHFTISHYFIMPFYTDSEGRSGSFYDRCHLWVDSVIDTTVYASDFSHDHYFFIRCQLSEDTLLGIHNAICRLWIALLTFSHGFSKSPLRSI